MSKAKDRWVAYESSWSTVMLLIFNMNKKPFDDIRVRQALSLAIDRYTGGANLSKISIMKHVGGLMRPGSEWALPQADLEKVPGFSRDIEKSRAEARRLLKEAGAEGLKIKLFNRNLPEPYTPTGIFVIDEWRKIGVATEHVQVETKMYFENLVSGSFDVALWPATEPADDPTAQLYYFLTHGKSTMSYARHTDAKLDELYEKQYRVARCRRAQAAGERVRSPRPGAGLLGADPVVEPHHRARQEDQGLDHVAEPLPGHQPGRRLARRVDWPRRQCWNASGVASRPRRLHGRRQEPAREE